MYQIVGGGSALLPSPVPPITLEDIGKATKVLQGHGATIQQLNLVRKNIEILKGGGLAKVALPAKVFTYKYSILHLSQIHHFVLKILLHHLRLMIFTGCVPCFI